MERHFKNIEAILPPPPFHMVGDGFRVHNFSPSLPVIGLNRMRSFVMNTETEIKKAYEDYYNGIFGYLEE